VPSEPADPEEEEIVPDYSPGYSPDEEPVAEGEAREVDPIEQFMESGRVLVDKIIVRINAAQAEIDRLKREADALAERQVAARTVYDNLVRQKGRIEGAVLAAIATAEDAEVEAPEPAAKPDLFDYPAGEEPVSPYAPRESARDDEIVLRPSVSGSTRLATRMGYVPQPGKLAQREWALNILARDGRFAIQDHIDAFCAEYGLDRDRGIKNLSSIMGYQLREPSQKWPEIVRVEQGVYATK
jgi:hypothetical protein